MTYRRKKLPDEIMTQEFRVRVCLETARKMQEYEQGENGLPVYRLIQIAVDNELEKPEPFKIPLKYKDEPYVEDKYAHEAHLLFDFIKRYTGGYDKSQGISLLMLMLLRRKIGISDRERVYRAYIELINSNILEEFYPKYVGFVYPKWFRHVRLKSKGQINE